MNDTTTATDVVDTRAMTGEVREIDADGRTVTVYLVTGMTCGHCAASVTEEIEEISGVRDIAVDVPSGRVTVTSDAPLDRTDVDKAVSEAGFTLVEA